MTQIRKLVIFHTLDDFIITNFRFFVFDFWGCPSDNEDIITWLWLYFVLKKIYSVRYRILGLLNTRHVS